MEQSRWAPSAQNKFDNSEAPMDEFAQTREPDNLFDDDFTPISEPVPQPVPPEGPRQQHHRPQPSPAAAASRGRGLPDRGGYRGARGRGGLGRGAPPPPGDIRKGSQVPTKEKTGSGDREAAAPAAAKEPPAENETAPTETAPSKSEDAAGTTTTATTVPPTTSNDTTTATPNKPTPAVRGNRLPTGGVQKPKLTEAELSERLAAAKLKSAKLEAAHAAAAADEAEFLAREAAASERRRVEGAYRRAQDQERERNRARKLRGQGGREWDEGKREEDFAVGRGRGRGAGRGMHGGMARAPVDIAEGVGGEIAVGEDAFSRPPTLDQGPAAFIPADPRSRGRGGGGGSGSGSRGDGRGEFRGRGRGRGVRGEGRGHSLSATATSSSRGGRAAAAGETAPPGLSTADAFPALQKIDPPKMDPPVPVTINKMSSTTAPGSTRTGQANGQTDVAPDATAKKPIPLFSPTEVKGSWADQMDGV